MTLLARLRSAPWLGGALLLALAAGLTAPLAWALGPRRWPLLLGIAAGLVLLFGGIERLAQRLSLPRRFRVTERRRFRVVPGGKGDGRGHDTQDEDGEKPRWVM